MTEFIMSEILFSDTVHMQVSANIR